MHKIFYKVFSGREIKIAKIKNLHLEILFIILLSLVFILWGRILYHEFGSENFSQNLNSREDRIAALSFYGWEVLSETEKSETVAIPQSFDKVYEDYNKLQKLSGFDLTPYKGKSVQKFTYVAKNFPAETHETIYINILVYNGELIGGDCMSPALSGFILPLDRRFLP